MSEPLRIVSLLPGATDMLAALGLLDSVVGVSDDCNWPPEVRGKAVVARVRLDVSELPSAEIDRIVGRGVATGESLFALDAGLLASLQPDLIITQDLCSVCAVSGGLLATACPVGVETWSMNQRTYDQVADSVVALAERLGVRERGDEVAAAMRAAAAETRAAVAGLARPRVFLAEWLDPPYVAGHWLAEMVEIAGGESVLGRRGEDSVPTTWEDVLAERPDLVVVAACGFTLEQALDHADELALPLRTVLVDGDAYFARPGQRLADGLRQLAHLFHPEAVPDPGLPAVELPPR